MPMTDPETDYRKAERQLREMLFGDGETTIGAIKGEERRILASRILRRMKQAFDDAAELGSGDGAAPIDEDLRRGLKEARERAERETQRQRRRVQDV
jgi:hypothetical protein